MRSLSVTTISPDVPVRAVPEHLGDAVLVVGRDPQAARLAQDVAVLLAGPPDGRRIDHRQELLEVRGHHAVEEGGVAVLQGGQADVALEVVRLASEMLELEVDLLIDGHDMGRQQAGQPEGLALLEAEGEILVQEALAEERGAVEVDGRGAPGRDGVVWRRQRSHALTVAPDRSAGAGHPDRHPWAVRADVHCTSPARGHATGPGAAPDPGHR